MAPPGLFFHGDFESSVNLSGGVRASLGFQIPPRYSVWLEEKVLNTISSHSMYKAAAAGGGGGGRGDLSFSSHRLVFRRRDSFPTGLKVRKRLRTKDAGRQVRAPIRALMFTMIHVPPAYTLEVLSHIRPCLACDLTA